MTVGIHAYGGYVPRSRLQRAAICEANAWFNPALASLGRGERAMANWDEDAVTMAVEAVRDCLAGFDAGSLEHVFLASTSAPFQDRQNAGIICQALGLDHHLHTLDVAGSQRAGTSALGTGLKVANSGDRVLVAAAEKRRTRAASALELTSGDAAAAFVVGPGDGAARLLGQCTHSVDFVDHYRGQGEEFDYSWEERWIRDEGIMKIVPDAIRGALSAAGLEAADITHFCFPLPMRRVAEPLARSVGLPASSIRDNLQGSCGEAGAAHPLVLLCHTLETAGPGDTILVTGFGQGCDALILQATDAIADARPPRGIAGSLARRQPESNYHRYLGINNLVTLERGLRAEVDKQTGLSTLYRNREMVMGLVGGRCTRCGTAQFPKGNLCVNPNCHAVNSQEPHPFRDVPATLLSHTADRLTYSPSPPAFYGMVQFLEGGRAMIDLTDIPADANLAVGMPLRMMFRVKDYDPMRGFRRYFWKAAPDDDTTGG